MIRKAIKLISIFLVVGTALYIVTFNGAPTTVYLSGSNSFQASTGVVLIITFALGILFTSVIAAFFALKAYFRERQLIWRDRQSREFFRNFLEARGISATGDHSRAQSLWETLVKSDPTSTIARIELSRLYLSDGKPKDALRVLDEARAHDSESLEILKLAADVNISLNNKTAALDNLTLLVTRYPTIPVVAEARDLAEELHRPEAALRLHEMLYSLGARDESYKQIKKRLEFKLLLEQIGSGDSETRRTAINGFLKKNKNYPLALAELAAIEQKKNNPQQAAQLLADAARASGEAGYWYDAAKLWLKHNMPESALSAARTAVREAQGVQQINAELDLIRLQIALSRLTEANDAIDTLSARIQEEYPALETELSQTILVLKALCLIRLGEHREAGTLITKLSKFEFSLPQENQPVSIPLLTSAPTPHLSTP